MIQNICLITLMAIPIVWYAVLTGKAAVDQDAVLGIKSLDVGLILVPINILAGMPFLYGMSKHLEKIPYVGIAIQIVAIILMYFYITKWNHIELYLDKEYMERFIRECNNFNEEEFKRFKKEMTREEQINWLKSLRCDVEEDSEPETIIENGNTVSVKTVKNYEDFLISDENFEIKDFECFLKER